MDLEGTVSVVTGAASGIGRATAVALAQHGSEVIVADIDDVSAAETAREIGSLGRRALAVTVDVASRESVEALVDEAIAWRGHCDVFISNAGVGCVGAPQDYTHDQWTYLLGVNLWSCIWPLRRIIPHMLERGRGHLVFVSSGAGIEGQADRAPYNVAKFGIVGLAESLARYFKETDVDVTLVIPGAVATDGWKLYVAAGEHDPDELEELRAKQRDASASWPRPETMAELIVEAIRTRRYCVIQHNPREPDWFASIHERKGRDPDAFVLG